MMNIKSLLPHGIGLALIEHTQNYFFLVFVLHTFAARVPFVWQREPCDIVLQSDWN